MGKFWLYWAGFLFVKSVEDYFLGWVKILVLEEGQAFEVRGGQLYFVLGLSYIIYKIK